LCYRADTPAAGSHRHVRDAIRVEWPDQNMTAPLHTHPCRHTYDPCLYSEGAIQGCAHILCAAGTAPTLAENSASSDSMQPTPWA
jgi:hypothetical protein